MTPSRRLARGLGAAAAALCAASALPAAASAATASGATTIELRGPVARALRSEGVRVAAVAPARATATRIALPVRGGTVASRADIEHRGAVVFRARAGRRTRTLRLTAWQTRLGRASATVSARVGARRVAVFAVPVAARRLTLDRATGAARLTGGTARLAPAGARAIRRALGLRRLPAGRLGSARVNATLPPTASVPTPGTPTDPGTPSTPGTPRPAPQCSGFSTGNVPEASAPLDRALFADARAVADAPMRWYVRDSWIRYMNGGLRAGDGITPSDGAVPGPVESYPDPTETYPDPSRSHRLVYSFTFAFDPARSWYAPDSERGVLFYRGSVRFLWADHGIDLTLKDPELQLDGAASRAVFTVVGAECSRLPARRVSVLALTPPARTGASSPYGYGSIPARMTADGKALFSGQYVEGQEWGSFKALSIATAP